MDKTNFRLKSELVYEFIRAIRDPEKDADLESLGIVDEDNVEVESRSSYQLIRIIWTPTSPNCSLASIIGLSIRKKLEKEIKLLMLQLKKEIRYKLEIRVEKGRHNTEEEINRQLNDKERYEAALENPDIYTLINRLIKEN